MDCLKIARLVVLFFLLTLEPPASPGGFFHFKTLAPAAGREEKIVA